MIAIDTSILVRHIMGDDPVQSPLASDFLENRLTAADPGFVSLIAIYELSWVLRKLYGRSTDDVTTAIGEIVSAPNLAVEHAEQVSRAIASKAGLADALIHLIGRSSGCTKTVTFDRKFARMPGVELLG